MLEKIWHTVCGILIILSTCLWVRCTLFFFKTLFLFLIHSLIKKSAKQIHLPSWLQSPNLLLMYLFEQLSQIYYFFNNFFWMLNLHQKPVEILKASCYLSFTFFICVNAIFAVWAKCVMPRRFCLPHVGICPCNMPASCFDFGQNSCCIKTFWY